MNKKILIVVLLLVVIGIIALSGCIEEKPKQNITEDYKSIKKFSSQKDFEAYMKYVNTGYTKGFVYPIKSMAMSPSGVALTVSSVAQDVPEFSKTNIQVEGVDEADIVKNDGKYIYVVSNTIVFIIDAYPAENAKILSKIKFNESVNAIFINKDKLIIFTQKYPEPFYYVPFIPIPRHTKTNIFIYDISDRVNPKIERKITVDGNYFDSRMIGDYVYVIVKDSLYYPLYSDVPILPKITIDEKNINENFPDVYYWDIYCDNYQFTTILSVNVQDKNAKPNKKIFLMGDAQNMYVSSENIYITTTQWMNDREIYEKVIDEVIVPNLPEEKLNEIKEIENSNKSFYMKKIEKMLVIAEYLENLDDEQMQNLRKKIDKRMQEIQEDLKKTRQQTLITKIEIKDGEITPKANGAVPGQVLNQFSMDEHNKNFRIATTTQEYNGKQSNNLYVLDENLKIIGKIEDIAKGERIYAVRFMGKKAYMVTFKRVDPLFVIDLSNPEKPELVGKLKIPGYSDYLHPYDENHLIGIGHEVDESIDKEKVHSDDSVYYTAIQGIKLSIFDVSDINHPIEMYKEVIGDRGTDSEALHEHKAFLFDKNKNILVIPILLAEISEAQKKSTNEWKKMQGEFTFQGAYVYNISLENGFKLNGRITHIDDPEIIMKTGYYFDSPYSIKRSLYIDNVLYTISSKKIKMKDLKNVKFINEIELD